MVGAIATPIAWGVAGAAHEVIVTLLGRQWIAAVPVLAILALAVPFELRTQLAASLCEATASLNVKIAITVGRVAWLAFLLVILARFGIVGIAAAFALSELATHVAYLLVLRRLLTLGRTDLWRAYEVGLAAGAITGLVLFGLHAGLASLDWPAPAVLTLQVAVGSLCLLGTVTKARGGLVWREMRKRLSEAGYGIGDSGGTAWFIRRMDSMVGGAAPTPPTS